MNAAQNTICPTTGKRQYTSEQAAAKGLEKFRERMPGYEGETYLCMYVLRQTPLRKQEKTGQTEEIARK